MNITCFEQIPFEDRFWYPESDPGAAKSGSREVVVSPLSGHSAQEKRLPLQDEPKSGQEAAKRALEGPGAIPKWTEASPEGPKSSKK